MLAVDAQRTSEYVQQERRHGRNVELSRGTGRDVPHSGHDRRLRCCWTTQAIKLTGNKSQFSATAQDRNGGDGITMDLLVGRLHHLLGGRQVDP